MAYRIDPERCNGCTVCFKSCPVGAISGTKKELHVVDPRLCIECSVCGLVCPKDAVWDPDGAYVPKVARNARPRPVTELESCTGCAVCVDRCPVDALEMVLPPGFLATAAPPPSGLVARVKLAACVGCGICALDCPYEAIEMKPLAEAKAILKHQQQADVRPAGEPANEATGEPADKKDSASG